ncbi:MAG: hypothetical protein JW712_13990, partial [Dehalococcoidales bacterium]|nr:hypothetical protein [Dehalococcoidales bacterium]
MKKVGLFLVSLLLTLVTLAGGFPAALPVAYAEGEVPVSICPAYTEVLAGTDFAVSVDIGQVSNLNGGQYDIWYDDQVIEFTGVDNGKIGTTDVPCQSNNWTGHIRVLFSFGFSSVAGSGNLSVIHFKAKNPGYTAVYFSDGLLSNMEANPIPSEWNDGSVQVNSGTPPAQVSIQPAHTTATEGDNFTVAVNVDQVADLNRAEFDILYDDQILEFFGVSDGNIGGTIIPCIFNDLTGGRVHVSGNLTVTTASGSGNISFLHFKTLDAGPSPLSFDSASLYYTNDAEIPASWYNGSVQVNPSGEPQAVPVFINPPHTEILQGTVFSVAASIGQVTDLNSAQFDLWYDD